MGAISEFLGEIFSAVDFYGIFFYLDCKVLFLAFTDKVLLGIEMFEAFCCCYFVPVAACKLVMADGGG